VEAVVDPLPEGAWVFGGVAGGAWAEPGEPPLMSMRPASQINCAPPSTLALAPASKTASVPAWMLTEAEASSLKSTHLKDITCPASCSMVSSTYSVMVLLGACSSWVMAPDSDVDFSSMRSAPAVSSKSIQWLLRDQKRRWLFSPSSLA
jgi:hypothetical protein